MKTILLSLLSIILLASCNNSDSRLSLAKEIESLGKQDSVTEKLNAKYKAYISLYPKDTLSSKYLLELAKNYLSNTTFKDSAAYYAQLVYKDYPKSKEAPEAMFFYASLQSNVDEKAHWYNQTYEQFKGTKKAGDALIAMAVEYENAGDKDKALESYKAYLASYPNGAHAKDAQLSIKNINIPLEELIKQFEKKN